MLQPNRCQPNCIYFRHRKGHLYDKKLTLWYECQVYQKYNVDEITALHMSTSKNTLIPRQVVLTFALSFVNRGHDFPTSDFRRQHNTDLSVRLCFDSWNNVQTHHKHNTLEIWLGIHLLCHPSKLQQAKFTTLFSSSIQSIHIFPILNNIINDTQHRLSVSVRFKQ